MPDDVLLDDLVKGGRAHRRVYVDPEIFELEMDRIFGRVWLYAAHESQLRAPGDFVRTRLGRHEVIITRHTDGTICALHNRCAHRGARLCMSDRGHAHRLICPYHAWAFRSDGSLASVPHRESYPEDFNLDAPINAVQRVPRVESYRGFVFASHAAEGPSLAEYLSEIREAIDNLVERAPDGEIELATDTLQLEYRGNWKFHNENAFDIFHPGLVHSSSVGAAQSAPINSSTLDSDQTRTMMLANGFGRGEWEGIQLTGLHGGHTYMGGFYRDGALLTEVDPVWRDYSERLAARYGAERATQILGVNRFNNLFFPTLNINAQYQQMRLVVPLAVDRTLIRVSCFRLLGAPDEIFHRAVRFLTTLGSPASMIFSDDMEMLGRCQEGLETSCASWLNFERGLGTDREEQNGRRTGVASELPMRTQLNAWMRYMSDSSA